MTDERSNFAALADLVTRVRQASADGQLVSLAEAAAQCFPESTPEDAIRQLSQLLPQTGDLKLIGEGDEACLYHAGAMTDTYARLMHCSLYRDNLAVIANFVRENSRIYPRPTPLAAFCATPFGLSEAQVREAIKQMANDARFADIRTTAASNGDLYLYSSDHLGEELAASLAEWDAVGQFASP